MQISVASFVATARARADSLCLQGARAGQSVAIVSATDLGLIEALFACFWIGAIPCLCDAQTPKKQLEEQLDALAPTFVWDRSGDAPNTLVKRGSGIEPSVRRGSGIESSRSSSDRSRAAPTSRATPAFMAARDPGMILPTSGSEGVPKLCKVSLGRLILGGHGFGRLLMQLDRESIVYCPLPLTHATALMGGVFASLVCGASIYVPKRFSASRFWHDVQSARATHGLYVGEMLRFVLARAGLPKTSTIRRWVGNGLDRGTWLKLSEALPRTRIVEFYGATELSALVVNLSGRVGAMGRVPFRPWSRFRVARHSDERNGAVPPSTDERDDAVSPSIDVEQSRNVRTARVDTEANLPARESREASAEVRVWKECAVGEPGELLIEIPRRRFPLLGGFEGYVNRAHESNALLRDVFAKGDLYYRSFDVVHYDRDDFFYFVDRAGDLWRHRGHNVSTSWVASRLRECPEVDDCVVIPLRIDESPHRVGLAVVVTAEPARLSALERTLTELPSYARPEIIALTRQLERTETFKLRRAKYRDVEGLAPFANDALYRWRGRLEPFEFVEWPEVRRRLLADDDSRR
ncbi:MAG: AMP-binding protein [Polyangiaceae bacterium]